MNDIHSIFRMPHIGIHGLDEIEPHFALRQYTAQKNNVLFREGDKPDTFFIVKSGQILVSRQNQQAQAQKLSVLSQGRFFGEVGLAEKKKRTVTARPLIDSEVYQLDRERFMALSTENQAFSQLLSKLSMNRTLRKTAPFWGLDDLSLFTIQKMVTEKMFIPHATILHEEQDSDGLYLVLEGYVEKVRRLKPSGTFIATRIMGGDFFGETCLLNVPNSSTFYAGSRRTRVLFLSQLNFQALFSAIPQISLNMLKASLTRGEEESYESRATNTAKLGKPASITFQKEKCLACRTCELACFSAKLRTANLFDGTGQALAPSCITRLDKSAYNPRFVPKAIRCNECTETPCISSCNRGAIRRDDLTGIVLIDEAQCNGCGLCQMACPSQAITVILANGKRQTAFKCDGCLDDPQGPACVRNCPTNALGLSPKTVILAA